MESPGLITLALASPAADGEGISEVPMAVMSLVCREFRTFAGTRPEARLPAGNSTAQVLVQLWQWSGNTPLVVEDEVDVALILALLLPWPVSDASVSARLLLSPRSEVTAMVTMQSSGWVTLSVSSPAIDGEGVVEVSMASISLACREFRTSAGTRPEA